TIMAGTANGVLTYVNINTGALTYRPNNNFPTRRSSDLRVNDGQANSSTATVTITVTPVNDAPVANGQSISTPEDTAVAIQLTGSDVEHTSLIYIIFAGVSNVVLTAVNTNTGAVTYSPNT